MKKTRYLWGGVFVVLLIIAGYWLGQKDYQGVKAQGQMEIAESYYNFGVVGLDKVSHTYKIKNIGEGALTIVKVSTSCGCTTAQLQKDGQTTQSFGMDHGRLPKANFVLGPGEETDVIVTYNPMAHGLKNAKGKFRRLVYLKTDNPRDEYELSFDVTVDPDKKDIQEPKIELNRSEYDFGQIPRAGGAVETVFQVTNTGGEELVIERIATSCGCTTAEIAKQRIAPGETVDLTVRFDPDFHDEPQERLERIVTLFTNDPNMLETNLTIYAEIID